MTDRHLHCVYFQYTEANSTRGHCLLKNKTIERGYEQHCEDIVLRPTEVLTYFLKHECHCEDWVCADKKALEYLERVGFNNYPKKQ